jgi:nickel transport protein
MPLVNEVRKILLFSILLFFFSSCIGFAHSVSIFAWVEGDTIYTESYFADGTRVKNGKIEVLDSKGDVVHQGITDENGEYSFKIPEYDNLTLVLDASMGHRATFEISAEELRGTYKGGDKDDDISSEISSDTNSEIRNVSIDEIRTAVREEVSEQLKPVLRDLALLRSKRSISTREIFAGIGYVLGLMGIAMYFKSKKKK